MHLLAAIDRDIGAGHERRPARAKALGITVPDTVLARADEVIE